jgi:bifunctional enzyme CysN/CysC
MDVLRFITCGSVDDGKSTLIGRLLYESNSIFDDQMDSLKSDSKKYGTQGEELDLALIVDGLTAEREQGITIDVAYRFFSTEARKFIVADCPGHEQYTRNMVTGASTADVAVILIDATKGVLTQTRRHSYLASMMGIKHVVLAINKIDLIGYSETVFNQIVSDFPAFNFDSVTAIPLSALKGDNVTTLSKNTEWYKGQSLLDYLETIHVSNDEKGSFIFQVQLVSRPNSDFRGYSGSVISGTVNVGDTVRDTLSGKISKVSQIVTYDGQLECASKGDMITICLEDEIDISRGSILTLSDEPLQSSDQFEATIVWMVDKKGLSGRRYGIKLSSQSSSVVITNLKHKINVNTLEKLSCNELTLNDIATVNLTTTSPLVIEPYAKVKELGSFILIDKLDNSTAAIGMINHDLRRSQNVYRQDLTVTRSDRESLNGHTGKVLWFTGLSGSGKSSIANELERVLYSQGKRTYVLDGDNVRQGLNNDLGFTETDRVENIRRVVEVSKLMTDAGLIVLTAFISPFEADRQLAREKLGDDFIEIFVDTPLEICEARDVKGLYKKARSGQIPNFTGVNSPYERPSNPMITLDGSLPILETVQDLLFKLNLSSCNALQDHDPPY